MNPAMIIAIIQSLSAAIPELVGLFDRAKSGLPVSEADVQAILQGYNLAHAQLDAAIAAAKTSG